MTDEDWRAHERRWRADPSDQAALAAAVDGLRRAGLAPPSELLDAQVEPARQVTLPLPLAVWVVPPGGGMKVIGWGPGTVEVPRCRTWGVLAEDTRPEALGAVGDLLRDQQVPGLRLVDIDTSTHTFKVWGPREDAGRAVGAAPHLRWLEVTERRLDGVDMGALLEGLGAPGLQRLHLDRMLGSVPRAELAAVTRQLAATPRLREVALRSLDLEDLVALRGLLEVDSLRVAWNDRLRAADVVALPSAGRLRRLELGSSPDGAMDDADLVRLVDLPLLERLTLHASATITLAGARALARAPAVTALAVEALAVDAATLAGWADGLRLRELDVRAAATDGDLAAIGRMTDLERLDLAGAAALTDEAVARLADLPALTSLGLGGASRVDGRGLGALRALEHLGHDAFTDEGLAAVGGLERLTSLSVEGALSAAGVRHLASLGRLQRLTLRAPALDDAALEPLRALGELARVTLQARHGLGTLGWLGGLPRLTTLSLVGDAPLTAEGLGHLRRAPLRQLHLGPGADDVDALARGLGGHPTLRRLIVHGPACADLAGVRAALPDARVMDGRSSSFLL